MDWRIHFVFLHCQRKNEKLVALTCRFALDSFTVIHQDYAVAAEEVAPIGARWRTWAEPSRLQPSARVDVHEPRVARLFGETIVKVLVEA